MSEKSVGLKAMCNVNVVGGSSAFYVVAVARCQKKVLG